MPGVLLSMDLDDISVVKLDSDDFSDSSSRPEIVELSEDAAGKTPVVVAPWDAKAKPSQRRGRGRPRKTLTTSTGSEGLKQGPSRGRGRPKTRPRSPKDTPIKVRRRQRADPSDDSSTDTDLALAPFCDSDCEAVQRLKWPKCRVSLRFLNADQVRRWTPGRVKAPKSWTKTLTMQGQTVRVQEEVEPQSTRRERRQDFDSRVYDLPRRSTRDRKVRYDDDAYTSFEDESDDSMMPLKRRKRLKKSRKARRARSREYDEEGSEHSDDVGSESSSSSSEDEKLRREASKPLISDFKVISTIDMDSACNRKFKTSGYTMTPHGRSKEAKYWLWFVQYVVDFWPDMDPFHPTGHSITAFLQFLRNYGFFSNTHLTKAKRMILNTASLAPKDKCGLMRTLMLPRKSEVSKHDEKKNQRTLAKYVKYGTKALDPFVAFCHGLQPPVNPFTCDITVIKAFLKAFRFQFLLNQGNSLDGFILNLCKYHRDKSTLQQMPEIQSLLQCYQGRCLGLLSWKDITEEQSNSVLDCTPDYRYEKYLKKHETADDFWRERIVFQAMESIFNEDSQTSAKNTQAILYDKATNLGVSPEMMVANFCKMAIPLESFPSTIKEFLAKNPEGDFYEEHHVNKMIQRVRDRKIPLAQACFDLGLAFRSFQSKVGRIKDKEEVEVTKPQAPKKNALEKQLETGEKTQDMSDYEAMRLRNIQERLALFKQLNFESFKPEPEKRAPKKKEVELREKSQRVIRNQGSALERKAHQMKKDEVFIPSVDLNLTELASLGVPFTNKRKFLSCLQQELAEDLEESSSHNGKPHVPYSGVFKVTENISLTNERLTCLAIGPTSKHLDLLAAGDREGSLHFWLRSSDSNGSSTARSCSFHPHVGLLSQTAFIHPNRIVTSGLDGFMRSIDLTAQKVAPVLKWFDHGTLEEHYEIKYFSHRNENELIVSRGLPMAISLLDLRSGILEPLLNDPDLNPNFTLTSIYPQNNNYFSTLMNESIALYDIRQSSQAISSASIASPRQADFSPDGSLLLAMSGSSAKVFRVDPTNFTLQETGVDLSPLNSTRKSIPANGRPICWNPMDKHAVFGAVKSFKAARALETTTVGSFCAKTGELNSDLDLLIQDSAAGFVALGSKNTLVVMNANASGSVSLAVGVSSS
ncbi:hypothetical protein TCAL_04696 [Tigriopus californicus]|uniref:Uncharacterized protein n=1 Tax=Tigriopus californicus TaxID=6832 RepID=A0A553NT21_TIGCA|nr:uncharacterized protein LOC131878867 [Tigriopus californicus]TRY68584.1 hypothetical protein TCAL_04696 [Tigriopus californicus]